MKWILWQMSSWRSGLYSSMVYFQQWITCTIMNWIHFQTKRQWAILKDFSLKTHYQKTKKAKIDFLKTLEQKSKSHEYIFLKQDGCETSWPCWGHPGLHGRSYRGQWWCHMTMSDPRRMHIKYELLHCLLYSQRHKRLVKFCEQT